MADFLNCGSMSTGSFEMDTALITTKNPAKKLTYSQIGIISILYKLVDWELPKTETLIVSEPDSTSDPPIGDNALRGPPLS